MQLRSLYLTALISLPLSVSAEQAQWAVNAGVFDAFRSNTSAEVGFEYRFSAQPNILGLIPAIGFSFNDDGAYWAHAGMRYDFSLSKNWLLTPNFSIVGYEKGAGKDLGGGLHFRTGLELAYQLESHSRIGLGIYHLSNANLHRRNPGAESVYLTYSFSPKK
ncbi:lipid A 3-O-deacylase (PagL) [Methylophaga lonarensis MPL]|uniref:Lipid A 3-O-deacylase (PagL) n=1 Tax=Methylophaga lonarensis MPL TaxID=1286106 RepID=M7NWM4_9GAMM|nr:acyloxyacyl hydrolase [Methylophaga lonarensis]EMR13168.1 lipid A 3-O-deacylase (PagL) [Methylophaga lonarensis MPL]